MKLPMMYKKMNLPSFGIFNCVACCSIAADRSRLTVTHSYYDCNEHHD